MIDRKIYLEEELDRQIRERADKNDRSITAEMRVLLRLALEMVEKTEDNP